MSDCTNSNAPFGITIAVCCHNSSSRLRETLKHISDQRGANIAWEVLLIDNASSDDTAQLAKTLWPEDSKIPLRVIHEKRLGLSYARERAISESNFAIVNFVDDDNWLAPDWLATAAEIMERNPRIGACGGHITAAFESAPPHWFERFKWMYAVSNNSRENGDVTDGDGFITGAGLILRREAWQDLVNLGFSNLLTDRAGNALSSGGDSEICAALRLAGWRLWTDPNLKITHYIESRRLTWDYLCKLSYGFGRSWVITDLYYAGLGLKFHTLNGIRATRTWKIGGAIRRILGNPAGILKASLGRGEGDKTCLDFYNRCGRIAGLIAWTTKEETFWNFLEACKNRNRQPSDASIEDATARQSCA